MTRSKTIISAAGYTLIVFPLAFVWHLVLFPEAYRAFGYFTGEPNIPVGLASIIIQGAVLAVIYPLFRTRHSGFLRAFQFAGLLGMFFWTSHVLALVAKQNVPNAGAFVVMESGYLVMHFGLFALLLGVIYRQGE